jgi:cellulose synthase/poly-beta-1,6-N-acetylglucosamine synthase-like glycosyltransferase
MIFLILFWLCGAALFHSYIFYPLLLKVFSLGKKENERVFSNNDEELPEVFIVMSVYNEEKVIREKLESIFQSKYPVNKLNVFIGSDNSIDKANSIIAEFGIKYPSLLFMPFSERTGKPNVLNSLIAKIESERKNLTNSVFVFTDANVMFTPETIYEMVKHFKNREIGQVSANILNTGVQRDGISFQEKSYIRVETIIKHLEGLNWGTMMGAFGGCFAMRASNWVPIPANYIVDDFHLSMSVLGKGEKAILEKKAICYEDVSNEVANEFNRKARIQSGNFQNLRAYWKLLLRFDAVAFCFFSHKVLRWAGPLLMLVAYVTNFFLLPIGQFYQFTFVVQNLLLLSPLIDSLLKSIGIHLILLRFASYFTMMNFALAKGFVMYMKGIKTNTWNRTERNIPPTP